MAYDGVSYHIFWSKYAYPLMLPPIPKANFDTAFDHNNNNSSVWEERSSEEEQESSEEQQPAPLPPTKKAHKKVVGRKAKASAKTTVKV